MCSQKCIGIHSSQDIILSTCQGNAIEDPLEERTQCGRQRHNHLRLNFKLEYPTFISWYVFIMSYMHLVEWIPYKPLYKKKIIKIFFFFFYSCKDQPSRLSQYNTLTASRRLDKTSTTSAQDLTLQYLLLSFQSLMYWWKQNHIPNNRFYAEAMQPDVAPSRHYFMYYKEKVSALWGK